MRLEILTINFSILLVQKHQFSLRKTTIFTKSTFLMLHENTSKNHPFSYPKIDKNRWKMLLKNEQLIKLEFWSIFDGFLIVFGSQMCTKTHHSCTKSYQSELWDTIWVLPGLQKRVRRTFWSISVLFGNDFNQNNVKIGIIPALQNTFLPFNPAHWATEQLHCLIGPAECAARLNII